MRFLALSLFTLGSTGMTAQATAPDAATADLTQRMTQLVWDISAELQRLEPCHHHPDPFRAQMAGVYEHPEFAALRSWFKAAGVNLPPALPSDQVDAQPSLEACVARVDQLLETLQTHQADIRSLPQADPPAAADASEAPAAGDGTDADSEDSD